MSEQTVAPNSVDGLKAAIGEYQKQQDQVQQQIALLDQNYHRQREQSVSAMHMLAGAMAALDQLVKNVEAAESAAKGQNAEVVTPAVESQDATQAEEIHRDNA